MKPFPRYYCSICREERPLGHECGLWTVGYRWPEIPEMPWQFDGGFSTEGEAHRWVDGPLATRSVAATDVVVWSPSGREARRYFIRLTESLGMLCFRAWEAA